MYYLFKAHKKLTESREVPCGILESFLGNNTTSIEQFIKYEPVTLITTDPKRFENIIHNYVARIINKFPFDDPEISYNEFKIPKKKGGYRELSEPNPELKRYQKKLLDFLQNDLKIPESEWAFAYIPHRSTLDMAEKHKDSKYFVKIDIKDFFPSIDSELLLNTLQNIYHTNELYSSMQSRIINVAIHPEKNCLPQGSPLSPYLSNLVMLDFDYKIKHKFPYLIYTRYADDIIFSSSQPFYSQHFLETVNEILKDATMNKMQINREKTKILKNTSRLYLVGIKLNKDNQLTYGHEKKKELKLALYNLFKGYEQGTVSQEEAWELLGKFSYMKQIEPNYADYLERKLLREFNSQKETIFKHFKF